MPVILKYCKGCKCEHPDSYFHKSTKNKDGLDGQCKKYRKEHALQAPYGKHGFSAEVDPRHRLLKASRKNAKAKGLEHTITRKDIKLPKYCCYLGVKLIYQCGLGRGLQAMSLYSATIDRIDSTKGYIPGNIRVISHLANQMKSNATIPQLVEFAHGILKTHSNVINYIVDDSI